MNILLPYGKQGMEVSLPEKNAHVLTPPGVLETPSGDPTVAAIESPLGTAPFEEIVEGKRTALIAMADHHRFGTYQKEVLSLVLNQLHRAHVGKIRILVARGTHPPATRKEWEEMYGKEALTNYEFLCHDPHDKKNLVDLGTTEKGDPVVVSRWLLESDLVVGIGLLRPSARGGYTGGSKLFAVGCAGYSTIMSTHKASLYFHPKSVVGNYQDHPFRERILAIAKKAEKKSSSEVFFTLNVIQQGQKSLRTFAGDMEEVWRKGCQFTQTHFEVPVPEPADILVCGGGFPLDSSAYAFLNSFTRLYRTNPIPLVREGGVVITLASLDKEPENGSMDESILDTIGKIPYERAGDLIREIENEGKSACKDLEGLHMIMSVAALFNHARGHIFVVGAKNLQTVRRLRFTPFETFSAALDRALDITGPGAKILVVPKPTHVLPYVGNKT